MNITRLDIAFDDHTGVLDIEEICEDTRRDNYVSKSRKGRVIYGVGEDEGDSVEIGSRSSEILIRIYDKAAERGFTDGRHWVRAELQIRRDRARSYISLGGDPGQDFCGVLVNYLRYVEPDGLDSNRWRWPMKEYWRRLIDNAQPIQLYSKPGLEYNMGNLETFLFDQAGGAATTWIQIYGIEKFQERLKEQPRILNAKYRQLLQEHGKL